MRVPRAFNVGDVLDLVGTSEALIVERVSGRKVTLKSKTSGRTAVKSAPTKNLIEWIKSGLASYTPAPEEEPEPTPASRKERKERKGRKAKAAMEVTAVIRKCKKGDGEAGKPWCLYTKDGKRLLGRHKSKEAAHKQEAAIKARQAGGSFVLSTLDQVAEELDQRGAVDLATLVDSEADDLREKLDATGFDDLMTRDQDVAVKIHEEKIPMFPPELL